MSRGEIAWAEQVWPSADAATSPEHSRKKISRLVARPVYLPLAAFAVRTAIYGPAESSHMENCLPRLVTSLTLLGLVAHTCEAIQTATLWNHPDLGEADIVRALDFRSGVPDIAASGTPPRTNVQIHGPGLR